MDQYSQLSCTGHIYWSTVPSHGNVNFYSLAWKVFFFMVSTVHASVSAWHNIGTGHSISCTKFMLAVISLTPFSALLWHHNERDDISNRQPHDCLLNRSFRPRSKKTSKLRITGICAGNAPETAEFPTQMASNAENVSIWWCHHIPLNCTQEKWDLIIISTRGSEALDNIFSLKCIPFSVYCWNIVVLIFKQLDGSSSFPMQCRSKLFCLNLWELF